MREDGGDIGDTGFISLEVKGGGGARVAEGDVEDSAVLGSIDVLAGVQAITETLDVGLASESEKGVEDGLGDEVFGEVKEKSGAAVRWVGVLPGEMGESERVLVEEVSEDERRVLGVVDLLESAPGGVFCGETVKVSLVGLRGTYQSRACSWSVSVGSRPARTGPVDNLTSTTSMP